MSFLKDIEKHFRLLNEAKVDRISDKEAEEDFEDLDDKDIDNDGDTDKSDKYLHKRLGKIAKVDEASMETGLTFTPRSSMDATKFRNALDDSDFHYKWNAREGYFFFPEEEDTYDALESELQHIVDMNDVNGHFEGIFNEMSTTAGVPGYQTPYAFGKADDDTLKQGGMMPVKKTNKIFKPIWNENVSSYKKMMSEMYGMQSINEAANPTLDKAVDKFVKALAIKNGYRRPDAIMAIFESLKRLNYIHPSVEYKSPSGYSIEEAVSYRDYKKDPTSTPAQKVNAGIMEVNRMLSEMEKIVHNNLRLKTEMGVQSNHFWKSTSSRFSKINERIVRISNKLKELSQ